MNDPIHPVHLSVFVFFSEQSNARLQKLTQEICEVTASLFKYKMNEAMVTPTILLLCKPLSRLFSVSGSGGGGGGKGGGGKPFNAETMSAVRV